MKNKREYDHIRKSSGKEIIPPGIGTNYLVLIQKSKRPIIANKFFGIYFLSF